MESFERNEGPMGSVKASGMSSSRRSKRALVVRESCHVRSETKDAHEIRFTGVEARLAAFFTSL